MRTALLALLLLGCQLPLAYAADGSATAHIPVEPDPLPTAAERVRAEGAPSRTELDAAWKVWAATDKRADAVLDGATLVMLLIALLTLGFSAIGGGAVGVAVYLLRETKGQLDQLKDAVAKTLEEHQAVVGLRTRIEIEWYRAGEKALERLPKLKEYYVRPTKERPHIDADRIAVMADSLGLLELKPERSALLLVGLSKWWRRCGNVDAAALRATRAEEVHPTWETALECSKAEGYNVKGGKHHHLILALQVLETAEARFASLTVKDPGGEVSLAFHRAWLEDEIGRTQQAERSLRRALSQATHHEPAAELAIRYNLACLCAKGERDEEAFQWLDLMVIGCPEDERLDTAADIEEDEDLKALAGKHPQRFSVLVEQLRTSTG